MTKGRGPRLKVTKCDIEGGEVKQKTSHGPQVIGGILMRYEVI